MGESEVGANSPDFVIDEALNYLGPFDRPRGLFNHLNWGPIKHKGSNQSSTRRHLGSNLKKNSEFNMDPKQTQFNSNLAHNGHEGSTCKCTSLSGFTYSKSGTLGHT